MIAIPNMEIPNTCGECELRALDEWEDEYCVILRDDILVPYERMLDCPLIEIDDEIWEALKPKVDTMSMALTGWVEDSNADQRTQCVESVEGDEQEEWLDYREEQEFNDRWEKE